MEKVRTSHATVFYLCGEIALCSMVPCKLYTSTEKRVIVLVYEKTHTCIIYIIHTKYFFNTINVS